MLNISIIILIIIILIIFLIPIYHNHCITYDITRSRLYKPLNETIFKTGDVLLFRWNYSIGEIDRQKLKFTLSPYINPINIFIGLVGTYLKDILFIHVGIIVRHPSSNKLYILELNVSDLYCNYENKVLAYKPTLTSLDIINDYYGVIAHLPYKGSPIPKQTVNNILLEKHKYLHSRHNTMEMVNNLKYYLQPNDINCNDIDPLGTSLCPKYINCLQYVIIVLKKMKIIQSDNNLYMSSRDLLLNLINSGKYENYHLLYNKYLEHYIEFN